jgi:predicted nucleotidyltransferase
VPDAQTTARDLVRQRYPSSRAAYLGGSAATGRATPTSDLDIFVLLGEGAGSIALTDAPETARWAERSRRVLAAGPPAADASDLDGRRYMLSALVDDLAGDPDRAERYIIEAEAFRVAAELVLLIERQWLGTGKWLVRNLRGQEDHGLLSWADSGHDARALVVCRRVLEAAGGYLQEGYVRGHRPTPPPA